MYYCFTNGEFFPAAEARWPIYDLGLLRGYGLFEYFRSYNGRIFRLDDYLTRFFGSAASLQIYMPYGRHELVTIINELNEKTGQPDVAFRMILTGGVTENGMIADKPSLAIVTEAAYPGALKTIRAMTQNYLREYPRVKSTNYINLMLKQKEFAARNVQDVLYHWDNKILEFSRSNVFLVKDKKLITPKDNILLGMTRRSVLEIAAEQFECEERDVSLNELWDADEVFLTASGTRIAGVTHIDNCIIGNGELGIVTQRVSEMFDELTCVL